MQPPQQKKIKNSIVFSFLIVNMKVKEGAEKAKEELDRARKELEDRMTEDGMSDKGIIYHY